MIENILILDVETTGLDPRSCKVIEIGVILYNLKERAILQNYSTLLPCEENPVEHINGIKADITRLDMPLSLTGHILTSMLHCSQAIVAHNASFDKGFMGTTAWGSQFLQHPWICTKNDFKWPVPLYRYRLQDICQAMSVPYIDAHRSLTDCNLLAQCFNKVDRLYDLMNLANKNAFSNKVGGVYV